MRKIFPFIIILVFLGCSYKSTTIESLSKNVRKPMSNGYLYLAALIEAKTNFSSLLYDKTKVKIVYSAEHSLNKIYNNKKVYIMPFKKLVGQKVVYDETLKSVIKNYIIFNRFALVTEDINEADYVVFANLKSSLDKSFGENFSQITISVYDKNENIVFYSVVKGISVSDDNFWYYPTKSAKPTSYISLKTMEYLLKKQFPKAFERGA
ncbi:conserved hypothetical protein [Deferribacter desulfuricans SSM1]|uniref:Lipoprotein n=1 Tax=Deferribacter desulfuricans (strain DSM 14783 / JCM 11476 / NBRC 101012 / SSM1) TaxID=639282 RepID=D3PA61_DEFDS|nr:hypothetical protein [Deferribacter desulfuricans]BAI81601.1 conserved hypothetical protein [Deferribacter desulfuricans SSM1]